MNRFGNALTLKDIDDHDIEAVEQSIRDHTLNYLIKKVAESVGDGCDVLVPDEMLEEYFGNVFKYATDKFKFFEADKKTIKRVAEHVKRIVDDGGENKGLKHFVPKRKPLPKTTTNVKKMKKIQAEPSLHASGDELSNESIEELKIDLFNKIMDCLKLYKVDQIVDLKAIDQNIVNVHQENEQIFGEVTCIICLNDPNKKKQKPKRMSYHSGNGSKYWIPSNFISHLKNVHKLCSQRIHSKENCKTVDDKIERVKSEHNSNMSIEIVEVDENSQTKYEQG